MKKLNLFLTLGILLLSAVIISSGCKKKTETIVPAFTVTALPVTFQDGSLGLQFYGKCNNDDVKMTKVTIFDPISSSIPPFNCNGTYFVKNETFGLQDPTTGYNKQLGTWTFNFQGNRTADGVSFSTSTTLSVTGK